MTLQQVSDKIKDGLTKKTLTMEISEGTRRGVRPHANLIKAYSGRIIATVWLQLDGKIPKMQLTELATEELAAAVFGQINSV